MKIYLSQTNYKCYNDDNKYPMENIKKQYDVYCKQNMYFDTITCILYCNKKWISKYSRQADVLEERKELKEMTMQDLIKYCARWHFRGEMRCYQDYYLQGGKIKGY